MQPRDEKGRLVAVLCPDPNCSGTLIHEIATHWGGPDYHRWYCDGITHERADDELIACPRSVEGPRVQASCGSPREHLNHAYPVNAHKR